MKLNLLAITTCLGLVSTFATAAPVLQSQSTVLSTDGQDMTFIFNSLPATNAAGGLITISPSGGRTTGLDLSGEFPGESENFEVRLDGVSQGFFSCGGPSNNGSTAIAGAIANGGNFNNCVFSLPVTVANSFLADGALTVDILFGASVSTLLARLMTTTL